MLSRWERPSPEFRTARAATSSAHTPMRSRLGRHAFGVLRNKVGCWGTATSAGTAPSTWPPSSAPPWRRSLSSSPCSKRSHPRFLSRRPPVTEQGRYHRSQPRPRGPAGGWWCCAGRERRVSRPCRRSEPGSSRGGRRRPRIVSARSASRINAVCSTTLRTVGVSALPSKR